MPEQTGGKTRVRINRYLAMCGLGARRKCEGLVSGGRILVNGVKVTDLATTIEPGVDRVEHKGAVVEPVRVLEYLAYHKPVGPVVTQSDPEGRATIYEAIRASARRDVSHLRYVGRLDITSEGLLLLTNDGDLVHALTHPRFHVKKVYCVRADRPLAAAHALQMVQQGVTSGTDILKAGRVAPIKEPPDRSGRPWYEVDLFEGKNRQVRRMFEGLGYAVERLVRVQFGTVRLADLRPGATRPLTERELNGLRNLGYPLKR